MADEALEAARVADRRGAAGVELPRFHGVPFTVKSNLDVAGTPTTHGLRAMAEAYPELDAPTVVEDGLPQVVQLIGPRYREDLCLDAAAALEDRLGIITPVDPR